MWWRYGKLFRLQLYPTCFFIWFHYQHKIETKTNKMEEKTNRLHAFLLERGIPKKLLPTLIKISKDNLVPIMEGRSKKSNNKVFYICVCTSGHSVDCNGLQWGHSGWRMRVTGKEIIFTKRMRKINLIEIPIFDDVLYVVSNRTKAHENAFRTDILCISNNRKTLSKKKSPPETNRTNTH